MLGKKTRVSRSRAAEASYIIEIGGVMAQGGEGVFRYGDLRET